MLSPEKRRYSRELGNLYKYLRVGSKEDGARPFSVVLSDSTGGNRHNLKHRRFHLHIRKPFYSVKVVKH